MKYIHLVLAVLCFAIIQPVFAGPCETVSTDGTQMELVDFGLAYSEDFKFNSQDDRLEFYNGVCIRQDAEDVWQLEAESIVIENVSVELNLNAEAVVFQFDGWELTADTLQSGQDQFHFESVNLQKDDMNISASDLRLDLLTDTFSLTDASAVYRNEFQISGESMTIENDQVVFNDAFVTTCLCEEDRLYDIRSPQIVFDEATNSLILSQSDLVIGNSTIPLGNDYVINDDIDLDFPTPFLAFGNSLELALKDITLAKGISLDLGAQGINTEFDFKPYALAKFNLNESNTPALGGRLKGVVGKATEGIQADMSYTRPFAENFSFDIGTHNRSWDAAGNLNDIFAGVSYRALLLNDVLETGIWEVVPRVFGALTSQENASEPVAGPRVGLSLSNNYAYGSLNQGLIRLAVIPEITMYPGVNEFQYALTVVPSLSIVSDGYSFSASYTHKLTNGASPFAFDRASEARGLNLSVGFRDTDENGNSFGLSTSTVVDFLKDSEANQSPVRALRFNWDSTIKGEQDSIWEFKPYLHAELARLITGIEDPTIDDAYHEDFFEFGLDSFFGDWEYGLRARFNPIVQEEEHSVEVLELGIGVPIRQGGLLIKPYVGVNFVSLFRDEFEFDLSTYGLSASYDCCGDASTFFRVRDGNVSTGLTLPF